MRTVLFGLLQLLCAAGVALALYHLIGVWLTVLIVSGLVGIGAVAYEAASAPTAPRPRSARLVRKG